MRHLLPTVPLAPYNHGGCYARLDDLVAKYKDAYGIQDNMLVRIDGKNLRCWLYGKCTAPYVS